MIHLEIDANMGNQRCVHGFLDLDGRGGRLKTQSPFITGMIRLQRNNSTDMYKLNYKDLRKKI